MTRPLHIAREGTGVDIDAACRAAAEFLAAAEVLAALGIERGHYAEARQVLSELETLGVDYGDVTEGLETNGLAAFDASWRELGDQLAAALRRRPGRKESGE